MKKKGIFSMLLVLFLLVAAACGNDKGESDTKKDDDVVKEEGASGKLVIYTGRDESVVEKVVGMFNEKYPDIQVDNLTMGAQQILERVRGEKANPQADFWWGGTQSAMMVAANEDLLCHSSLHLIDAIAADYKDAENRWYGEMLLPEVIMINSDVLSPETGPQDWDDLLKPEWKDKILSVVFLLLVQCVQFTHQ